MARQPRDDAPGVAHHVMLRGIERREIFRDDADREEFLLRLANGVPELGFLCFAWVLMPNHVHLVVRSGRARISQLMARLGTGYARYFNERHDRVGHLFQNRFRSRRVVDDVDLMGLVLYAVRNPLEAGLVTNEQALERFGWSMLGALLGQRPPRAFEFVGATLALFDADPERARRRIHDRLGAPASLVEDPPACPAIVRSTPRVRTDSGFEELLREVCTRHALAPEALRSTSRSPRIAAARSDLAARAVPELGLRGSEIARALGVTPAAVSALLARSREHRRVLTF